MPQQQRMHSAAFALEVAKLVSAVPEELATTQHQWRSELRASCEENDPCEPVDVDKLLETEIRTFTQELVARMQVIGELAPGVGQSTAHEARARANPAFLIPDGTLVIALIYLERLLDRVPELQVTLRNYQSLVLIAILLASKMHDDYSPDNGVAASFLKFTLKEINFWERKFLAGVGFDLSCNMIEFNTMLFRFLNVAGTSFDDDAQHCSKVASAAIPAHIKALRRSGSSQPLAMRVE